MCTIRRARIRKLIKQQRKGKNKGGFLMFDMNFLPVMDENKWEDALKLLNTKGVILSEFKPSTKIRLVKPRNI